MSTKKDIPVFHTIRALCVVWIVGIWHMNSYLPQAYEFNPMALPMLHNITNAVLATFTFMSGVLLSKYTFQTRHDVVNFYRKRLGRFLLLLVLSALTYFILHWISLGQLLQIITGTNLIFGKSAQTLWFFSMIILFYAVTPLLKRTGVFGFTGILILIGIGIVFGNVDKRLLLNFPFYYLGLSLNVEKTLRMIQSKTTWGISLLLSPILLIGYKDILYSAPIIAEGIILILVLSQIITREWNEKCFAWISVASMIAYLFHRQILSVSKHLFATFGQQGIPLVAAFILTLLIFFVSYWAQRAYSLMTNR